MRLLSFLLLFVSTTLFGQYTFSTVLNNDVTPVKNQSRTGTCWSFATVSFLESELMRQGNEIDDLSEMFLVRHIYQDKAHNYLMRQGKANFSQGGLSHDALRAFSEVGIVPESVYSGLKAGAANHDHSKMEKALKNYLDTLLTADALPLDWETGFSLILDEYMGAINPNAFSYGGSTYTSKIFADELKLNTDDYWNVTSFSHHPFYDDFVLEIPDNYSNEAYENVPLETLEFLVMSTLQNGGTVAWDGDVSEKGFSPREGLAILPVNPDADSLFTIRQPEQTVTQETRQAAFESWSTTDDHLMHIVGTATDETGNLFYVVKNSWGEVGPYNGYLYMSRPYFLAKTVGVIIPEAMIPDGIKAKFD